MTLYTVTRILSWFTILVQCSVITPPWNDANINPCSDKPNGWQLLYWPNDGECYRIFQKGYPCPETMELVPGKNGIAECNCPPGTGRNSRDAQCYKMYNQGPCNKNEYFGPVKKAAKSYQDHRWGACFEVEDCEKNKVFWPKDGKCYNKLTKGPCPEGLLLNAKDKIGECSCDKNEMNYNYWEPGLSCHEHFLQGPCEIGKIFLPNGECGCNNSIMQYYPEDKKCYAIGSQGPCKEGHIYEAVSMVNGGKEQVNGACVCKDGYIQWKGICYQPFTRGPCKYGEMLDVKYKKQNRSEITCTKVPCSTGKLFFPGGKGCHSIGTRGPCPDGQVVLHQGSIDVSKNGISYIGICGCPNTNETDSSFYATYINDKATQNCPVPRSIDHEAMTSNNDTDICESGGGMVLWTDQSCWQLYSQGPCKDGEWLVPDRGKGQRKGRGWRIGKCECRPGYNTVLLRKTTVCVLNTETLTKVYKSKL